MSARGIRKLRKSRQRKDPRSQYRKAFFEVLEDRQLLAIEDFVGGAKVADDFGQQPQSRRHELLIVDTATPDYQELVDGLNGAGAGGPEVVLLIPAPMVCSPSVRS